MQDKLHILEDLNMLYIRQIALSLEVLCLGQPGCSVLDFVAFRGWGMFVSVGQHVGLCSCVYLHLCGHPFQQWGSGGGAVSWLRRAGEEPSCGCSHSSAGAANRVASWSNLSAGLCRCVPRFGWQLYGCLPGDPPSRAAVLLSSRSILVTSHGGPFPSPSGCSFHTGRCESLRGRGRL